MDKATRNKILIGAGIAIVTAIGIGAAIFAPHIREITSVAQSAGMDQNTVTALEEENAKLDQDLRSRFGISDNNSADSAENPDASDQTASDAETTDNNSQTPDNNPQPDSNAQAPDNNPQPDSNAQTPDSNPQPDNNSQNPENNAPANTATPTPQPTAPTLSPDEEKLKALVQQIYDLRDTFSSRVDAIVNGCIAEFLALDPSEQTQLNKIRIVSAKLGEVANMEEDCDNQVADIVSQIREIDPALATQIEQQYENEKSLKKASLISQYGG